MAAKFFGVVHNKGQFCEIRYSWYVQHHHTLKRYFEHKRVRFQMDRVIRDHLESGYIQRVEYRRLKEPEQEIDYIIRYYPGPAAGESIDRIQVYIKKKRAERKLTRRLPPSSQSHDEKTGAPVQSTQTLALSPVTAQDTDLITQLAFGFGISLSKAYELTMTKKDAVRLQLEAWRFRDVRPRNRAGWMIQAIESNYDVPASYIDEKKRELEKEKVKAARAMVRACAICDSTGFCYFRNAQYPNGAMRQCTHDPSIEGGISPDAQNGPLLNAITGDEKRPAEDSTSP